MTIHRFWIQLSHVKIFDGDEFNNQMREDFLEGNRKWLNIKIGRLHEIDIRRRFDEWRVKNWFSFNVWQIVKLTIFLNTKRKMNKKKQKKRLTQNLLFNSSPIIIDVKTLRVV